MEEKIKELRAAIEQASADVTDKARLSDFWQKYLSKNGEVAGLTKSLRDVPKEDRPAVGKTINEFKQWAEAQYQALSEQVEKAALEARNAEGRLFEMSNIYIPKQLPVTELPEERLHLGFAAWGSEEDFFAVKGAVESFGAAFGVELTVERATDVAWLHPGIAAYILCKGERVGVFGKLANDVTSELKLPKDSRANLNIYLGEIDWVAFHALVPAAIHYQPIPEFAPVQRDLALVAPESMECGTLVTEMQRACKQLTKVELFDIYRGEKLGADKKSMAFSLSFQPADKPLTPDEIDRFVKKILGNLKFKLGIEIRE